MNMGQHSFFKPQKSSIDPADNFLNFDKPRLHYESKFDTTQSMHTAWDKQLITRIGIPPLEAKLERLTPMLSTTASSVLGLQKATIDLGVRALEHAVPGTAGYVGLKLAGINLVMDTHVRVKNALDKGGSKTEAMTCGVIGASASELTSAVGNAALYTSATKLTVETGGAGILAAGILLKVGHEHLAMTAPKVGDLAQGACHSTFRLTRQLKEKWHTVSPLPTSPTVPSTLKP